MTDSPKSAGIQISGTTLLLDGEPFLLQGMSFFNALYNPTFNRSEDDRRFWLRRFRDNGINTVRVFLQWDRLPHFPLVDVTPESTLYTADGAVRDEVFARLDALIRAADELGMVLETALFMGMGRPTLTVPAQERAVAEVTQRLRPHRRLILQIWNEDSREVVRHHRTAKCEDLDRLVTNSPGKAPDPNWGGILTHLGDDEQNSRLDLLTPHTIRNQSECFWEEAPRQVAFLLERFKKPVIDDELVRKGPTQFGGIEGGTRPEQHVEQVRRVRAAGGYHVYHHDMFQGPRTEMTPPNGIPDPDFSPFHRQVFDYLRDNSTW